MATGEKRSAAESEVAAHQECKAILLDVEGTTSSISFVKDTLFPYMREVLKKHVDEKWNTEEFKDDLAKLKEQAKEDEEKKIDGFVPIKEDTEDEAKESLIKNVLWQMDNDRKTGALKQLQGHIWKAGHKPIKGHVYDDVPKAFEEWTSSGKKLYIYSSGSVQAQKLLYGDSIHGNLLKYISGHFDTEVGPKQEPASYTKIVKEINYEPSDVLFLTDIVKEAEAAKEAGVSTTIVVREGNAKLSDDEKATFKTIESFAEITFQSVSKRQKLDEKDSSVEEKKTSETITSEKVDEPMDTSEDVEMKEDDKKPESTSEAKVVETKVEKSIETEKAAEKIETTEAVEKIEKAEKDEKIEKEVTTMEVETVKEETVAKTESEKSEVAPETEVKESAEKTEDKTDNKPAEVSADEPKSEEPIETEKEKEKTEKKSEEVEVKSEETPKVTETVEEEKKVDVEKKVEESVPTEAVPEKAKENDVDKVTDTATEAVTEKVAEVAKEQTEDKKVEEEAKSEEKENIAVEKKAAEEVKENGSAVTTDSEKLAKVENKENIENVDEKTKDEKTAEPEVEKAEEAKETVDSTKAEVEPQKEAESKKLNGTTTNGNSTNDAEVDKVHSNGVSEVEKTKENGDAEESIKVKKAVAAEGTGGPDVVTPPVVAATS